MAFQTEFSFELPKGYVDDSGTLHKKGVMRLATAADEILPMRDSRVQQNPGYITIILLARVIIKLGDVQNIDTKVIERLFTSDLTYLNDFYQRINQMETPAYKVVCPHCGESFDAEISVIELGE